MLILQYFNLNFKIWLKINILNFVVTVILSQKEFDELFYFIIYMFKTRFSVEYNYKIYNKKFSIIVRSFEKWHSKCVEISIKEFIRVCRNRLVYSN